MQLDVVVVVTPAGQFLAGVREAAEDLLIQAFITQAAVESFDQPILLRFTGVDVMPGDASIACPFEDRGAGELGAVNADDAVGFAVNPDHSGQLPRHARPRDAGIGNQPQILTGAVIADRQNTELARRTEGICHKIQRALGRFGIGIGTRVPRARFRPRRRRTDSPSSL